MQHPLDREVWNMLHGRMAHLAVGTTAAKRIDPSYGPFVAARDASDVSQHALAKLFDTADEQLWLVEPEAWAAPDGMRIAESVEVVQLVAGLEGPADATDDPDIAALGEQDAAEMAHLAHTTEPGPWRELTHRYGQFFGIRRDGVLVAMAGERMLPADGYAEVSGVCTLEEHRGNGLARRLIERVMAAQRARGDRPYLHAYIHNHGAIGLYESLGFVKRRNLVVTMLEKA